jgi:WhiB family redox-sensing transcriptional regulator
LRPEGEEHGEELAGRVMCGLSRGTPGRHGSRGEESMSAQHNTGSNAQGIVVARGVNAPTAWTDAPALIRPEPWMQDGACAEVDPESFFPEKGGSTRDAKSICRGCEVLDDCLAYALRNDERFGIWGGKSERERAAMKRNRAAGPTGEENR